jgi:Uma2 family endonuclease
MNLLVRPLCTFKEFCSLIQDHQKADLIDGIIYMASPDNTNANLLCGWLFTLLTIFVHRKKSGKVYAFRVAFRLDDRNGPEPDIGFVKKSRLRLVKRGHVAGRPDVAMEIVSPESVNRDYEKKRQQYEKAGVPEYWIIDEMKKKVLLLRLDKEGHYQEVQARDGILQSKVIKGFWLREAWLWKKTLPDPLAILKQILPGGR